MRRFAVGLLVLVSAISVVLASMSLWTRRNVVNTQVFVGNVEEVIDLPEVEARITEQVTATVMGNDEVTGAVDGVVEALPPRLQRFEPTITSGIESVVSAGVQRLLSNDPFRPLTEAALTSAHDQLVDGEAVEFTLGMAKERVPASLQDGLAGQVLDLLPDDAGVTLLTPAEAPQIYDAVDLLESVWWWFGLLALATLAGALGVSRHRRATLRGWSVTVAVLAVLVLLTLRLARGQLVLQARPENRDALGAAYDVFAQNLRVWILWVFAAALLVVVLTLVWGRLGLVAGVRRGVGSARTQLRLRREEAAAAPAADGTPASSESWTRRVATWSRAFADGLDVPERSARVGVLVRDHYRPARWTGISVGVLVLLLWPAPTLSVLIWIAALVGLYLIALDWLRGRAPAAAATEAPSATPPPATTSAEVHGVVPVPRGSNGPEPLVPAALTPAVMSTLSGRLDLLVRLGEAREAGVLTEEEFTREKSRLLGV
ncbi:SHOCT domain-containing protein [Blastococcus sp. SYSU D00922]